MQIELTDLQQRIVSHDGGLLRIGGGAGTGKTTALVHRYLRLAAEVGAARVLVLARHGGAARRFRQAVLPHLSGGFEALAITTPWGLALDLVRRHRRRAQLLTGAEQLALVGALLAAEAGVRDRWPELHPLVGRKAFTDEVAAAILRAQAANLSPAQVRMEAQAQGDSRWVELAGFFERYRAVLDSRSLIDGAGVLGEAGSLLGDPGLARAERARHPQVLVDDHEAATPAVHRLVGALAPPDGAGLVVAGNPALAIGSGRGCSPTFFESMEPAVDIELHDGFRHPREPEVVRCPHPSTEAEAVAGELLHARSEGVAWGDMAVLVRSLGARASSVTRALVRHGIPVAPTAGPVADEPAVRALVDLLRWAHGDDTALERLVTSPLVGLEAGTVRRLRREAQAVGAALEDQPIMERLVAIRETLAAEAAHADAATLAHRAFTLSLHHLVHQPGQPASAADDRALDALRVFLHGVSRHVERHPGTSLGDYLAVLDGPSGAPDPWVANVPAPGTVTVTSVGAAAGQEWHTVVVAGCVESELPRADTRVRFFDAAVLGSSGGSAGQRRLAALEEERRLFTLARSRATHRFVAMVAPLPGVLISRFVEGWRQRSPRICFEQAQPAAPVPPTAGPVPLWPEAALSLSASQLDTYQDCPLKHAYRYGLGVRGQGGVHANLGSLVHLVLERFCDPAGPVPVAERSRERLHALAEECWRDDLAPYRPQLEEARRDLFTMLDLWWDHEGGAVDPPRVLATEHPFQVEVGPHRLSGRIDRVDRLDGGGLRVVDYKTGKTKPRPDDVAQDLQLATYHLAASRDTALAAHGPVQELRLLHLRTMTFFEQQIAPGHSEDTERWILAVAERMKAEEPRPDVDADCDHCEFHRLCPLWDEGREVGEG